MRWTIGQRFFDPARSLKCPAIEKPIVESNGRRHPVQIDVEIVLLVVQEHERVELPLWSQTCQRIERKRLPVIGIARNIAGIRDERRILEREVRPDRLRRIRIDIASTGLRLQGTSGITRRVWVEKQRTGPWKNDQSIGLSRA